MPGVIPETARLWLFDIDGTLVAPSEDQLNAWVATFREVFGLDPTPATIVSHLGRTFAEIVRAVAGADGRLVPPPRIPEALAAYTRHVREALTVRPGRLLPGALELLDFLKERGNAVGVVTGNFREEGEPKLQGAGLTRLLDLVVYADLAIPSRDTLLRRALALARARGLAGDTTDTVVVGDSVHDIRSAHRTGALAIAVSTGLTPPDILAAAGPDLLVPDLPDLLTALKREGMRWVSSASSD